MPELLHKPNISGYASHILGTTHHKVLVFWYLLGTCFKLLWRALIHDFSKYSWVEAKDFCSVIHKLRDTEYNSDEYKLLLEVIRPALNHHYKHNRHHPEHAKIKSGLLNAGSDLSGMDIVDLVEMFADWKASVKRHKKGNIFVSIKRSKERFNIPNVLADILNNSAR